MSADWIMWMSCPRQPTPQARSSHICMSPNCKHQLEHGEHALRRCRVGERGRNAQIFENLSKNCLCEKRFAEEKIALVQRKICGLRAQAASGPTTHMQRSLPPHGTQMFECEMTNPTECRVWGVYLKSYRRKGRVGLHEYMYVALGRSERYLPYERNPSTD